MTADRDPAVGALLDQLPIEPPTQAFWDDLVTRLEAPGADVVVGLHPIASRPRRRRTAVAVLGAAAVIAVAVFVGGGLGDDGEDDLDVVNPPTPSVTEREDVPPTTVADVSGEVERAVATARTFLFAEDPDAVWELLGPQSRDTLGGQLDDATRGQISVNREDLHLRRAAPDLRITAVVVAQHGGMTTSLVTYRAMARVPDDGPTGSWSWSLMVQEDAAGKVWVEQYLPGQALGVIELPHDDAVAPRPLLPGEPVLVRPDPDALGFVVLVDGDPFYSSRLVDAASGAGIGIDPGDLSPGTHGITVGMVTASGGLVTAYAEFEVAAH